MCWSGAGHLKMWFERYREGDINDRLPGLGGHVHAKGSQ